MKLFFYFLSFFLLLLLYSCKSFQPVPPSETYAPLVFKPELSHINIPLEIPVNKIEASINRQVSGLLYEDSNLNDDDMVMKVWKKDNISLAVIGDEYKYNVPLKVWLKAGFKMEKFGITVSDYEQTECEITMNFSTKISIDQNWKINTSTTMTGYEWVTKPVLDYGILKLPLTLVADKVIAGQKQKLVSLLDELAKDYLDIQSYVQDAWAQVQKPISLSDDPSVWLKVTPVEVEMTPLMGRAGVIQSTVGMLAYSQVHIGKKPEAENKPLPKLKITNDETGLFSILLIADIFYDFAENITKKYFEGQVFSFKEGKKKIKIDSIRLYGSNDKIVIQLKVSGSLNGNVYLKGIPYYDAPTQSIKVKDIDYDLDTKNKLLKSADWLAHGVFIKKMDPYLSYSIKDLLLENEQLIEKGISNNRINKNIVINGRLSQLLPKEIFLSKESMKVVVLIKGILNIKIDGFE